MRVRRVLVTGSTGFVGTALTAYLDADGRFAVRCANRRESGGAPPGAERILVGETPAAEDWRRAVAGVDAVVHLAARVHVMRDDAADPLAEFRRVNVAATMDLAREAAAAGVKRLVFLSSVKVNGDCGLYTENSVPAPEGAYGISKHEAEVSLRSWASYSGMEVVIIRPPLVYGPGVKANFRSLMRAVARGIPLPFGAIHNQRSLIAVQNLVDIIVTSIEHPGAANETFLVSDGEDLSTTELIRRLGTAMGRPARLVPVPAFILMASGALLGRANVARRLLGSLTVEISKARRMMGWTPPVSVDEGLRRAVASL